MKKKNKRLKMIIPLVIVIFIALALVFGNKQSDASTTVVKTTEVIQDDIHAYVNSTGVVLSKASFDIASKVTGEVVFLNVKEGEVVKKNQILCELDQTMIKNQMTETEIQLAIAKENLVQIVNQGSNNFKTSYKNALVNRDAAAKAYADAKALLEAGVYSQSQVDSAYTTYVQASNNFDEMRAKYNNENSSSDIKIQELRIESLENALVNQQKELENTLILSPITGTVTGINAKLFTYVSPGATLFIVEDLDQLKVEINISQYDIHKVKLGQTVEIKADGIDDVRFEGVVSFIGSRAVNKVLRASQEMVIEAEVNITSTDTNLKPNFSARTIINTSSAEQVLVLPYESIYVTKDGDEMVYTVKENIITEHQIKKGVEGIFNFEAISDSLVAGDHIVLNPTEVIKDGIEVFEMDVE